MSYSDSDSNVSASDDEQDEFESLKRKSNNTYELAFASLESSLDRFKEIESAKQTIEELQQKSRPSDLDAVARLVATANTAYKLGMACLDGIRQKVDIATQLMGTANAADAAQNLDPAMKAYQDALQASAEAVAQFQTLEKALNDIAGAVADVYALFSTSDVRDAESQGKRFAAHIDYVQGISRAAASSRPHVTIGYGELYQLKRELDEHDDSADSSYHLGLDTPDISNASSALGGNLAEFSKGYSVSGLARAIAKMLCTAVDTMGQALVICGVPCEFSADPSAERKPRVAETRDKTSVLYYLVKRAPPPHVIETVKTSLRCDDDIAADIVSLASSIPIMRLAEMQGATERVERHGMAGAVLRRNRCSAQTAVFKLGENMYTVDPARVLNISLVYDSIVATVANLPATLDSTRSLVELRARAAKRKRGWGYSEVEDSGPGYLRDDWRQLASLISDAVMATYDERAPYTRQISTLIKRCALRRYRPT